MRKREFGLFAFPLSDRGTHEKLIFFFCTLLRLGDSWEKGLDAEFRFIGLSKFKKKKKLVNALLVVIIVTIIVNLFILNFCAFLQQALIKRAFMNLCSQCVHGCVVIFSKERETFGKTKKKKKTARTSLEKCLSWRQDSKG